MRCQYRGAWTSRQCAYEEGHSGLHRTWDVGKPIVEKPTAEVTVERAIDTLINELEDIGYDEPGIMRGVIIAKNRIIETLGD